MGPGVSPRPAASLPAGTWERVRLNPEAGSPPGAGLPERAEAHYPKPLVRLWGEAFVLAY